MFQFAEELLVFLLYIYIYFYIAQLVFQLSIKFDSQKLEKEKNYKYKLCHQNQSARFADGMRRTSVY